MGFEFTIQVSSINSFVPGSYCLFNAMVIWSENHSSTCNPFNLSQQQLRPGSVNGLDKHGHLTVTMDNDGDYPAQ